MKLSEPGCSGKPGLLPLSNWKVTANHRHPQHSKARVPRTLTFWKCWHVVSSYKLPELPGPQMCPGVWFLFIFLLVSTDKIPSTALGSKGWGNIQRWPPTLTRVFVFHLMDTLDHSQEGHPMWNIAPAGKLTGRQGKVSGGLPERLPQSQETEKAVGREEKPLARWQKQQMGSARVQVAHQRASWRRYTHNQEGPGFLQQLSPLCLLTLHVPIGGGPLTSTKK